MNRGNNKPTPNGVDDFIERLNKRFSRLLGKRDNSKPPQIASNKTFALIIIVALLLLWLCTGFYFLAENEYGLILTNGRVSEIKHGIKVGLTLPYPFGDVEIIDGAPSQTITIGATTGRPFIILDNNLQPVSIIAKFSYQVNNPKALFQNRLQKQDELDNEIMWQVQAQIRNVIATKDITELKQTNFTVLSNEVIEALQNSLIIYGITLNKLKIVSIQDVQDATHDQLVIPFNKMESANSQQQAPLTNNPVRGISREVRRYRDWSGD